ncbi:MAG: PDZ domain-containing protein [Planctomycetota bacterium]
MKLNRAGSMFVLAGAAVAIAAGPVLGQSAEPALNPDWAELYDWREIGPSNMGGRIVDMAIYEADPGTFYVATASGGLLKTTNNGYSFEHQFDDQSTVAIGDIDVFQGDPDIVWVGTGEENPRNSTSFGDGVYKSTDGGKTFKNMGLTESFQTGALVIHPEDSDTVLVGALGRLWGPNEERGIYKTTDGGESWDQVLYVDENTGCIDIVMDPDNPNVMLAAMWDRRRDEFDTNDPWRRTGPGSGIWRSTDGGDSWTPVTSGLPTVDMGRVGFWWSRFDTDVVFAVVDTERQGMGMENMGWLGVTTSDRGVDVGTQIFRVDDDSPASENGIQRGDTIIAIGGEVVADNDDFQRLTFTKEVGDTIEVTVMRDGEKMEMEVELAENPDEDYRPFQTRIDGQVANIQDYQGPDGFETGGLFKSTDKGRTWKRINSNNPRAMYYSKVIQDHTDPNYMWMAGTSLWRSEDGGETWSGDGIPGEVHVDHHSLWINPSNGKHLMLGNDGGLYITYDRGKQWDHHNHVAIGQFYHVQVDNRPLYNVYGGLQDNGTWGAPNRTRSNEGPVNSDWFRVGGGDGFIVMVDPEDPDHVYGASQNGNVYSVNFRTGARRSMRPRAERGEDRYRWNWKTPFLLSHHNGGIYYSAGNHVFRSLDEGENMEKISPEITRTRRGAGTALDESPLNANHIMVGTDDGSLWVTADGGKEWTNIVFPYDESAFNEDAEDGPRAAGSPAPAAETQNKAQNEVQSDEEFDLFEFFDLDRPASLDEDESFIDDGTDSLSAQPARAGQSRIQQMVRRMDRNRDGKLQKSEVPEQMQWIFPVLDVNEDDVLDRSELEKGAEKLSQGRSGNAAAATSERSNSDRAQAQPSRRAQARASAQASSNAPASSDDPIAGVWVLEIQSEQAPGEIIVEMIRKDDGSYAAKVDAAFIEGAEEAPVQIDEDNNSFTIELDAGFGVLTVKGEIDGDTLTGELSSADVGFSAPFTGAREGANGASSGKGDTLSSMLPGPRRVQSIEWSKFDEDRVYVVMDGHYADDDAAYVFMSDDAGQSWMSLTDNLPEVTTRVLREDLENEDLLYLGTEFGLYVSIDRGTTWTKFHNNLPTVAIHDIAQHETMGDIVLGTHGRSFWALDVTSLRQMTGPARNADAFLFEPNTVYRWRSEPSRGSGTRYFAGDNPDGNAEIFYNLGSSQQDISIEIHDINGKLVKALDAEGSAGLHKVEWNLRKDPPAGQNDNRFRRFGPLVEPGTYRVVMTAGPYTISRPLVVENDPEMGEQVFATDSFLSEETFGEEEEGGDDGLIRR